MFYILSEEQINLRKLREKLDEHGLYNGSATSLWRLLKGMGFKYKKEDPRRGLMELPHIALKRTNFLQQYMELKGLNVYNFVYLDETWILKDGTVGWSWQDNNIKTVKKTQVGGVR